jgi:hypothetical protein
MYMCGIIEIHVTLIGYIIALPPTLRLVEENMRFIYELLIPQT